MPTDVWKGKNRYGDTVGGERVAASKEEVGRLLQKDQITVFSVAPAKGGFSIPFLKREKVRLKDPASSTLIASGEQSGSLDIMLRRLSEFIEKNVRLRGKVKQAMIYPVAIVIFAVVVSVFLLWKVIPVFDSTFRDLGAELPFLPAC